MKPLRSLLLVLSLALFLIPATAKAEDATRATPPAPLPQAPTPYAPYAPYRDPAVFLELAAHEPITVTVYFAEGNDERPLFSCQTPCRVRIYPGKYRFHVRGGPEKIEADSVVDVERSQRLTFSLPKQSDKTAGLVMAITGTALIPTGLAVAWAGAMASACWDCEAGTHNDQSTSAAVYVGLGMMAVGAILTPVGWISFAQNRKPHYENGSPGEARARSKRRSDPAPARVGFGVAPTKGGATAAVWGSF
jgi:hypothetical protein